MTFGFSLRADNGVYDDREEVILLVSFFRTWTFVLWQAKTAYPDLLSAREQQPKWWHKSIGAAVMLREDYLHIGGKAVKVYARFLRWGVVRTWTVWTGRPPKRRDAMQEAVRDMLVFSEGIVREYWQPMRHHEMHREEVLTVLVCMLGWVIGYGVWGVSILGDWAPAIGLVAAGCNVLIAGAWVVSQMDET